MDLKFTFDFHLVCEDTDALDVPIGTYGFNFIVYVLPAIVDSFWLQNRWFVDYENKLVLIAYAKNTHDILAIIFQQVH